MLISFVPIFSTQSYGEMQEQKLKINFDILLFQSLCGIWDQEYSR